MGTITRHIVQATVHGHTARLIDGDSPAELLEAPGEGDVRSAVVRRALQIAAELQVDVELVTSGDRGDYRLVAGADGTLAPLRTPDPADITGVAEPVQAEAEPEHQEGESTYPEPEPWSEAWTAPDVTQEESAPEPVPSPPTPAAPVTGEVDLVPAPATRRRAQSDRTSFIEQNGDLQVTPAGWRRIAAALGMQVGPSKLQLRDAQTHRAIAGHWAGCRRIAVVNGKGGVGKTMTTAMLAAAFGRASQSQVLAWDNNDTRGTLGWRTEQSNRHDNTIQGLLGNAPELLSPDASVADIASYVHHQSDDRYDVLRSNPHLLAADQRIYTQEFDLLMQVAARYYRLVIFDSGNDESADRWLRMVDVADQLVIPTLPTPDSAESARLLLEALQDRDARSARLARNAVVVVTLPERGGTRAAHEVMNGFRPLVRDVQFVAFDPAMKAGPLRFDALRSYTQRTWREIAAAAADQF